MQRFLIRTKESTDIVELQNSSKRNGLTNGEVDIAIRIVKDAYEQHLRTHSFIEDSWDI